MSSSRLPDLGLLMARLEQAIQRARADGSHLAVLVVHVHQLKDIHETLGRVAGDAVLHQVASRWSAALEGRALLAHLGGADFACLLLGIAGEVAASTTAERLLRTLEQPFELPSAAVQLSGSIGIAVYPDQGTDAGTLLRGADVAASEARKRFSGYAVYAADDDHRCPEQLALAADLRRAVDGGELVLQYQPQVDVRSGALTAVEALVRWNHPTRGLLSPDTFIPIAEETRLIRRLSRFVLTAAVQQCQAWQAAGLDVRVAVNLSVHDLQDRYLPDDIAELLTTCTVAPHRLCIEITESALLADPHRARDILGRLRSLGVRTAIDDFGTGYSSLAYLKDLPLDELKIDRSFVQNMAQDSGARAIVRAVIDLAHDLDLQAIAEGVEDHATRQVLASLGCDVAQGYYFSPPVTAPGLAEWASCATDRGLDEDERARADIRRDQRGGERRTRLRAEEEFLARKRAEEALRASELRYRSVVDNIKDVIFQVDADGRWAFLSRAWEEVTGYSLDQSIGQSCLELLYPEDRTLPEQMFKSVAAGVEESCRYEVRFLNSAGELRWLEVFARPTRDGAGQLVGTSGTLSDITDRKQADERRQGLEQAEKLRALGQMASGVAHDLNQALGLIAGYGQIALRAIEDDHVDMAVLREALPVITQAALDGGETVRRLLTFARGQADGKPEALEVALLVQQVAGLTAPRWRDAAQAEGRPISFSVKATPGLFVCGRAASLREALTNLVFNAVDALPNGGTISLEAHQVAGSVVIDVTDSGVGIPLDIQKRIFEPFFSTKGERGTGLGLAQVFGIVQQHGADVSVDSTPGRGTRFRLTFAAAAPTRQSPLAPLLRPTDSIQRRLRILAVDDEPAMGSMIRRMLRADGHTVVTATSGEEALDQMKVDSFDVLISDIGMGPRMNGWELAEKVHQHRPRLPVVLATGWGATIDPAEAQAKGIFAVLAKPYLAVDLKNILARLTLDEALEAA